jgi:hypothetical protein
MGSLATSPTPCILAPSALLEHSVSASRDPRSLVELWSSSKIHNMAKNIELNSANESYGSIFYVLLLVTQLRPVLFSLVLEAPSPSCSILHDVS